jgi:hypothetical protein
VLLVRPQFENADPQYGHDRDERSEADASPHDPVEVLAQLLLPQGNLGPLVLHVRIVEAQHRPFRLARLRGARVRARSALWPGVGRQMTPPALDSFLWGASAAASWAIGLFFLRFWRDTRDRFFAMFATAFSRTGPPARGCDGARRPGKRQGEIDRLSRPEEEHRDPLGRHVTDLCSAAEERSARLSTVRPATHPLKATHLSGRPTFG